MADAGDIRPFRRGRGFRRTSALVEPRIKGATQKRGFAVARVLTHWAEIVGEEIGRATTPVDIRYGREGLGATLTLLVKGAEAPMLEMQKDRIRATVNACYGYNAIARVRFTQTAATGFAEEQAAYAPPAPPTDPAARDAAARAAETVEDPGLRDALSALGAHILSRTKQRTKV